EFDRRDRLALLVDQPEFDRFDVGARGVNLRLMPRAANRLKSVHRKSRGAPEELNATNVKLTLGRDRGREFARSGEANLPLAGPRIPDQDRASLSRAFSCIGDREVWHVCGEGTVGRRNDRPIEAAGELKIELQLPNADFDRDLDLAGLAGELVRLDQNVLRVRVVLRGSAR